MRSATRPRANLGHVQKDVDDGFDKAEKDARNALRQGHEVTGGGAAALACV